jgi:anaerobic selenocysteine-containing dehydrogenase
MYCIGQNPATSLNAKLERSGLRKLEWLVVKDNWLHETATFWKNAPEVRSGDIASADMVMIGRATVRPILRAITVISMATMSTNAAAVRRSEPIWAAASPRSTCPGPIRPPWPLPVPAAWSPCWMAR